MDSPGTLTFTHPPKKKHLPKTFLILTPNFPNGKKISHSFERTDHLTHTLSPIPKNYTEKFIILTQKKHFFKQNSFPTRLKKSILQPTKISYNYQKKQFFQTKNFLYLREKAKTLHFRCVLNMLMLFLIFENISQSLFINYF